MFTYLYLDTDIFSIMSFYYIKNSIVQNKIFFFPSMYVMKAILILRITDAKSGNNSCVDSNGE